MRRKAVDEVDEDVGAADAGGEEGGVAFLDPAELELAEFLDRMGAGGGQRISARVIRVLRPEDEGRASPGYVCLLPKDKARSLNPETLEDDILAHPKGGGGLYSLQFLVGGKYVKGGTRPLEISGPANTPEAHDGDKPAPTPIPTPATPALDPAAIRAEILREIEGQKEAERKEAERIASALAPVHQTLAEIRKQLAVTPSAPPAQLSERDLILNEILKQRLHGAEKPAEDPRLAALTAKLDALEAEKAREREQKQDALLSEVKQLRDAVANPPKAQGHASSLKEILAPVTEAFAISKAFRSMGEEAEKDDDDDFADLLKVWKKPAFDFLKRNMKKIARTVEAQQTGSKAKVPPTWLEWIDGVMRNTRLATDVEFVRASLQVFGAEIESLCAVHDSLGMQAFISKTFGQPIAAKLDEVQIKTALDIVSVLRLTVNTAKTTPAPPPPAAEAATDEADDEDEEEADDEEDEDDE